MNGFLKKTIISVLVVATVITAGWFGRKAYKKATERRLLTQAQQFLDKKDIANASLCLKQLLQVNPFSVKGNSLIADMLEEAGMPAAAVDWRARASQLDSRDVGLQFALAQTALRAGDKTSAETALKHLPETSKSSVTYEKLAGALAWSGGNIAEADLHYTAASRLDPTNMTIKVNLATVHLGSTNKAIADSGRQMLNEMTTNSALKLPILRDLARDAVGRKDLSGALAFSKRITDDPECAFQDKLSRAQLLRAARSAEFPAWESSLKRDALKSPDSILLLGQWIIKTEGPATSLAWLQSLSQEAQTNQPVPLLKSDCYVAMKKWNELLRLVSTEDWADANYYRLILESLGRRSLGQDLDATAAWKRALKLSAHRADHLSRIAQVTGDWGWSNERVEALQQMMDEFPQERWAVDQLSTQFYAEGNTKQLHDLLTRAYAANPEDIRYKNNLANILLLEKSDLTRASQMAKDAYQSSSEDPFFTSTYAYSLLLEDKPAEASEVISKIKQEYLKIPSVAAYYGTIEARSGHKDLAREPLALASTAHLLPEEKEMVRSARAQL